MVHVVPALQDSVQQQLMLRCHWEKFHTTLQSSTLMSVEGPSVSWESLLDISPTDVAHFFRVEDLTALFVAFEAELLELFSALVHCQFVPQL